MADSKIVTALEGSAALVAALAWPSVALLFGLAYRRQISKILTVLAEKLARAKSIKAGGVELAEELIDEAVSKASPSAPASSTAIPEIPAQEVKDAAKLAEALLIAGLQQEASVPAFDTITKLATNYDNIRSASGPSPDRTQELNSIMGQMRTLGLLVRPFLSVLVKAKSPGKRLAAIASLQVKPDFRLVHWLGKRFSSEELFVFYHSAIALRQLARKPKFRARAEIDKVLQDSLDIVSKFTGGEPDPGTMAVLMQAIAERRLLLAKS